jgi:hypothetical protein
MAYEEKRKTVSKSEGPGGTWTEERKEETDESGTETTTKVKTPEGTYKSKEKRESTSY